MTQTSEEVLRQQEQAAARRRAEAANAATRPKDRLDLRGAPQRDHYDTVKETSARATPNNNSPVASDGGVVARTGNTQDIVNAYLDTVAPAGLYGREINFDHKSSGFITRDDGEKISESRVFVALMESTAVGVIRFFGKGEKPEVHMALIYDGQLPPDRESLGDNDPEQWEEGLSGKKEDPYNKQNYLPLEDPETKEAFTLVTRTLTGIRAVGNLMRHYERLRKSHPDMNPLICLKVGGFNHRDERIGWVATPNLAVVGRHPKDTAAKADSSLSADMDGDAIPF
jgi:hypothetical protein